MVLGPWNLAGQISVNMSATDYMSVALFAACKRLIKTGGSRTARRHTFARQQKYAKVPSPCGGQLFGPDYGDFYVLGTPLQIRSVLQESGLL